MTYTRLNPVYSAIDTFTSPSTTFTANNVTSLDFNVAKAGFTPIGVIQHQFASGSANLCMSNCIVDGNTVKTGVMNRSTSAITTTIKIVVLYKMA